MLIKELINEITRRDFLRGAGALAGTATLGSPRAQTPDEIESILQDAATLLYLCQKYFPNDARTIKLKKLIKELGAKNLYSTQFDKMYQDTQLGMNIMSQRDPEGHKAYIGRVFQNYDRIVSEIEPLIGLQT